MDRSASQASVRETDGRSPLRLGLAVASAVLLGAGGLLTGGAIVLVLGLALALAGVEPGLAVSLGLGLLGSQVGIALVAVLYLRGRPRLATLLGEHTGYEPVRDRLSVDVAVPDLRDGLAVVGGWIAAIVGVVVALVPVSLLLSAFVESEPGSNPTAEAGFDQPELFLWLIPVMLLVVGPVEELLFRGVVQTRLREVFGPAGAIGLASLVFAFLHYFVLTGGGSAANALAVSILLVPALVLGAAYEYTDNLVVPALIHGLYNSTWLLLLYALFTYTDVMDQASEAAVLAPV